MFKNKEGNSAENQQKAVFPEELRAGERASPGTLAKDSSCGHCACPAQHQGFGESPVALPSVLTRVPTSEVPRGTQGLGIRGMSHYFWASPNKFSVKAFLPRGRAKSWSDPAKQHGAHPHLSCKCHVREQVGSGNGCLRQTALAMTLDVIA